MFCDSCGAPLQPGQSFCTRCGKGIVGPVTASTGRVAGHTRLLGVLWIAYSALTLLGGGVLMIVANTLFARFGRFFPPGAPSPPPMPMFLHPLLSFLGLALLIKGTAGVIAGVGLLQREPWGRVLALIVGIISLINIPFGTALGVYTLWVLLSPNADAEYRELGQSAGAR
jgi:hypothetical protein